jgi:hypothetical protein
MKFSLSSFFAAHLLLLVFVKATDDDSSVLPQCSSADDAADGMNQCGGGLVGETTPDDNVSALVVAATTTTTEIKAAGRNVDEKNLLFEQSSSSSSSSTCGAYWAESTIPNAGMGVFTARTIPAGATILNTAGEAVIHIVDPRMQTERRHATRVERIHPSNGERWLLNDLWLLSSQSMGSFEAADVKSFVPGLQSACNYHPGLLNIEKITQPINVEMPLHRSRDAGAGASTTHHGAYIYIYMYNSI